MSNDCDPEIEILDLYWLKSTYLSAIKISTKNKNEINCENADNYSWIHQALQNPDDRLPDGWKSQLANIQLLNFSNTIEQWWINS